MRLVTTLFCVTSCMLASDLPASIPNADNSAAYTERDYRKDWIEFNRHSIVDAYKSEGHHDPKWDEPALKLLEGMSRHFAVGDSAPPYQMSEMTSPARLEQFGREAISAGCDDPAVLDLLASLLSEIGKTDEARQMSAKAADQMPATHYPVYVAADCIRRSMRQASQPVQSELKKNDQELYDLDLATLKYADLPGIGRRIVLHSIESDLGDWSDQSADAFARDAKALKGNPWLTNMLVGEIEFRLGWNARGDGWAHTVTPEGWKGLAEHLSKASEYLTQAYKLQPEYPEAATKLISVALAAPKATEPARTWFDRAVTAQLDFENAYYDYDLTLWPRWGGSADAQYAFASECADTKRYDTRVPLEAIRILNNIRDDADGDWSYWKKPGVFEKVAEVLKDSAAAPQFKTQRSRLYSELAGFAWDLGRYDEAKQALDAIGGKMDLFGFISCGVPARRAVAGIYAMTGPCAAQLQQAESAVQAGRLDEALSAYNQVAEGLAQNDNSAAFVRGRVQELKWQIAFAKGEWVNIQPTAALDGWYIDRAAFQSDGNALTGTTSRYGASILCGADFGNRWELRCTVQILTSQRVAEAGPSFCWARADLYSSLRVRPAIQQIAWREHYRERDPLPLTPKAQNEFDIQDRNGVVQASVNREPILKDVNLDRVGRLPGTLLGIVSQSEGQGVKFRVTGLQIRKLPSPATSGPELQN